MGSRGGAWEAMGGNVPPWAGYARPCWSAPDVSAPRSVLCYSFYFSTHPVAGHLDACDACAFTIDIPSPPQNTPHTHSSRLPLQWRPHTNTWCTNHKMVQ
jgi:hypothetical protein